VLEEGAGKRGMEGAHTLAAGFCGKNLT
jgi:hypothetical protein